MFYLCIQCFTSVSSVFQYFSVFSSTTSLSTTSLSTTSPKTHLIDQLFFVQTGSTATNDKTTDLHGFDTKTALFHTPDMPGYPTVSSKRDLLLKTVLKHVKTRVLTR